ncbi:MAG TPA: Trp biosynthesis-associated membrane protein, partial [Kineosporiaceae bacterium]|nr:Trp biosynthesis-associated membrane protein [Kineosporiaceae bacterium]
GAIALAITGPLARRVVAALVVLAGLGTAGLVAAVLADPAAALAPFVVTATGQSGPVAGGAVAVTGWPWAAIAGGVLTGLAGLVALLRSGSWASGGRRFEPGAGGGAGDGRQPPGQARAAAARRDRDLDTWEALSRGDDPTES